LEDLLEGTSTCKEERYLANLFVANIIKSVSKVGNGERRSKCRMG